MSETKTMTEKSKLLSISNNLMVEDVDATLAQYTSMGFEIVTKTPKEAPTYWAYIEKDNVELFFQSTDSLAQEFPELKDQGRGGALTLWFRVDNVPQWYDEINDKAEVIRKLGVTEYNGATEFVIRDINGFILHFSDFDLQGELKKEQG